MGHVFQGRFKSVLIDNDGAWLLVASAYLHLNPVRVAALGLGKARNAAERGGVLVPDRQQIQERLKVLRAYRWSSCRVYAGYVTKPEWLVTGTLWRRAGGRKGYRDLVQGYVTRGAPPAEFDSLRERLAIGGEAFRERLKREVGTVSEEQPDRRHVVRTVPFETIVKRVEEARGDAWEAFRDRRGDWGRDMVLSLARQRSGLTLRQLGERVGGVNYWAVAKAVKRFETRLGRERALKATQKRLLNAMSNVQT